MQPTAPAAVVNVPAGHRVAEELPPTATKLPAGAGIHAAAPITSLNVPGKHGVAEVLPDPAAKLPAGARVHGVLPAALKLPAGQAVGNGAMLRGLSNAPESQFGVSPCGRATPR